MRLSHETRFRVRYAETDQMRVAYHSNHIIWFEVGRVELCRSLGVRYRDMEQDGVLLAVAEVNCRYLSPVRYDDEVIVKAWVEEVSTRMIQFRYEIRVAEDGRLAARGFTKHLFCDRELRRIQLPERYQQAFGLVCYTQDSP
jgi:acyl-CoA thioester hydrolase